MTSIRSVLGFIVGKLLGGLFAIAAMVLLVGLWKLQMLPSNIMLIAAVLITLLVALVIVLTWSGRGKVRMTFGIILAVLGIFAMSVGTFFTWKMVNTINRISAGATETVQIGVYMRNDDKRELAANFRFGIWAPEGSDPDEAVNSVIEKLNKDLDATITGTSYETLTELMDALLDSNLDAIILNEAFLDVLTDVPGYEEVRSQIRKVFPQEVEVELPQTEDPDNNYTSLKDSFAVYISGIDARYGGVGVKTRSDVNIIAVVNPQTKQVLLVNTPRDYYVPISSPQSYLDGRNDKLTHAGLGGPEYSKKTLSNLYGIDVAYYFKVNFSGFVNIVDSLDGITVQSEYNFRYTDDDGSVYYYQKGENELNGKEALGFCRNRYSFASGDNQRGKNQMAVIKGVINKALSPKLLTNYTEILDAVSESMEMTVPMDVIGDLVSRQLSDGGEWNVVSYSVTGSGGYAKSPAAGGAEAYMMFPNEESVEQAKQLIQDVIDGKTLTPN